MWRKVFFVSLVGLDTDGDGLDDRFDSSNVSIKGTSYNVGNGGYNIGDVSPGARAPVQRTNTAAIDRDWRSAGFILASTQVSLKLIVTNGTQHLFDAFALTQSKIKKIVLEQSEDGVTFKQLEQVAADWSNTLKIQTQLRAPITVGPSFYRLAVFTENAQTAYSNVIRIFGITKEITEVRFTNPNSGDFTLSIKIETATSATIELIDNTGRVVYSVSRNLSLGRNVVSIAAKSNCVRGLHVLRIRTRRNISDFRLMIQD